jgi:hypothetical protein
VFKFKNSGRLQFSVTLCLKRLCLTTALRNQTEILGIFAVNVPWRFYVLIITNLLRQQSNVSWKFVKYFQLERRKDGCDWTVRRTMDVGPVRCALHFNAIRKYVTRSKHVLQIALQWKRFECSCEVTSCLRLVISGVFRRGHNICYGTILRNK